MLSGRRSLRIVERLTTRLPKSLFIHHGLPVVNASRVHVQRTSKQKGGFLDSDAGRWFTSAEAAVSDEPPVSFADCLNYRTDDATITHGYLGKADVDVVSVYSVVRLYPSLLQKLRAVAYYRIAKHASMEGLQQVMGMLSEDLLSYFPRDEDPAGFSQAIIAVLSHANSRCPLSRPLTLRLFETLIITSEGTLPTLDPDVVERIATAAFSRPDVMSLPLEILGYILISYAPKSEESRTLSTQLVYKLLMKVMLEGEDSYQRALGLFRAVIDADRIPKRALAQVGEHGDSFLTVVTTALFRACFWYGWHNNAATLLLDVYRNPEWVRAYGFSETDVRIMAHLTFELLNALLSSPSKREIEIAQLLIMSYFPIPSGEISESHALPSEIPHDILFLFYDSCHHHKLVAPAAQVYHHFLSPQLRRHHFYPPPQGEALLWLLDHFSSPGRALGEKDRNNFEGHLHIARALVQDVLHREHEVIPIHRPRLVALAAARGFGLYARQLWELYTAEDDPNRDIVRGNARVLVQLVKLFVKTQERLDNNGKCKTVDGEVTTDGSLQTITIHSSGDHKRFAEQVLASYIETKAPLHVASHYDLNALARAQLLLGQFPEAVSTLENVVRREDTPRTRDINVTIAGLAHYSPTRAAGMILDMLSHGVLPSAATFSTILHTALKYKEVDLIERLILQARGLGYNALTPKGMASLIRSAVTFDYTSDVRERQLQQRSIRWAMSAVEKIMRYRLERRTPHDGVKDYSISIRVCVECVKGSLKALQPHMAFRFWSLLVQDRWAWDDKEHTHMRAWIARAIRLEWRGRRVATNRAAEMLEALGTPGVEADGPRGQRGVMSASGGPGTRIM